MLATHEQNARTKLAAIIVSVIVIAGVVVFADHLRRRDSDTDNTPAPAVSSTSQSTPSTDTTPAPAATPATQTPSTSSSDASNLTDGNYTASSNYRVPPGQESIRVSVTLQNGVITDSSIQNSENDRDSAVFQENFAALYKSHVVGKKISGLRISNLAGASDTAQGFNEALIQIVSKAQA